MSKGLIERLRARADMHVAATPATMLREAAARIRELEAERDEAVNQLDSCRHTNDVWERRAANLRDERDKLREVLKTIARGKYDGLEITRLNAVECRVIAARALSETEGE